MHQHKTCLSNFIVSFDVTWVCVEPLVHALIVQLQSECFANEKPILLTFHLLRCLCLYVCLSVAQFLARGGRVLAATPRAPAPSRSGCAWGPPLARSTRARSSCPIISHVRLTGIATLSKSSTRTHRGCRFRATVFEVQ